MHTCKRHNGNKIFNKGRIMNAAFKEALKIFDFQCAVFHDVDLIPEDDRNMYTCPQQPRHLSVAIDEMNYKLGYDLLVGGVLNMRVEHYKTVNGYSNMYVGWGAEDDDMAYRIVNQQVNKQALWCGNTNSPGRGFLSLTRIMSKISLIPALTRLSH
ncbi:hypothetical protein LOTGIDRAFT_161079 [Lottia gigantea]|uniref:Galactosyltransferase C-terminal domain-containing protein n=1 Tax=Lottia gigantea TaxID=225164 RepID=V4ADB7_LOTGI|nr:hypothetical protein LOTGIDRAFT_161079 [Lottia gigantea]ESO94827.1 hypothetical protein LOTGIDRAFT_161079 [Lottia gigantea]